VLRDGSLSWEMCHATEEACCTDIAAGSEADTELTEGTAGWKAGMWMRITDGSSVGDASPVGEVGRDMSVARKIKRNLNVGHMSAKLRNHRWHFGHQIPGLHQQQH
jgi:hypothetical protein